jgi:RimJ/RimL family protein N-acetyltransferase
VHFGLIIAKPHRGKGFGELLLRKCIGIAKKRMKPHRMWIEHVGGNNVAAKLYRKVGFVQVACLREYVCHFGKWHDRIQMEYKGK